MQPDNWDGPPLDAWQPWHPQHAAALLAGLDRPWCVVGGWAIDLWLGAQTRPHEDLEVAILRADFGVFRAHLGMFKLHSVGDGCVRELPPGALPPAEHHQNWVFDVAANAWRMDLMLEPGDAATWVFRRDETIRAPRGVMIGRRDGIPFLEPQGVLLYKAKAQRPKDDADFRACLPHLSAAARGWLKAALEVVHPGHSWLIEL